MTFWNFTFFRKTFLDHSPYEYSNEWVDDVITSQFSTHFIYKTDKNLIFQLWECKACLISTQNKWEIMFILIYFDTRICFTCIWKKNENVQNFMYNMYDKLWGDDTTNSLIWIFIRTGQEMFSEKCEISKCQNFLISYPIFIIFAPICREIFTFSFEIMVILDWTSPLKATTFSS